MKRKKIIFIKNINSFLKRIIKKQKDPEQFFNDIIFNEEYKKFIEKIERGDYFIKNKNE